MKKFSFAALAVCLILTLYFAAGCAQPEEKQQFKIRWAADESECDGSETYTSGYQEDRLPRNVTQLKFILIDDTTAEKRTVKEAIIYVYGDCQNAETCLLPDSPEFLWKGLPTGRFQLKVIAYQNDNDGQPVPAWVGINPRFTIADDKTPVEVNIFMKRIGKISTTFGCMKVPRAFHQAVKLRDGSILVFGGVSSYDVGFLCDGTCDQMIATDSVEKFDPTTGRFVELAPMAVRRAFHKAMLLEDSGLVIIVGGAQNVLYDPRSESVEQFGSLFHPAAGTMSASIEIYDPSAGGATSGEIPLNEGRALFDMARIVANPSDPQNKGELFVISGGLNDAGKLHSAEIINHNYIPYESVYPIDSPVLIKNMINPRAGHSLVAPFAGDTKAAAIGGAPKGVVTMEYLGKPTVDFVEIANVNGDLPNTLYALSVVVNPGASGVSNILVYGGMAVDANGKIWGPNEKISSTLVSFSVTDETPEISVQPANTLAATAFAAGINLSSDSANPLVIISGGGYGSDLSSVSNNIEYTTDGINFAPILSSGGVPLTLRAYINPSISDPTIHGRMGHTATLLPEGGVIFIGGLDKTMVSPPPRPTAKIVLSNAEIVIMPY